MNKKDIINEDDLWQEKFRPKTIKDIILPLKLKRMFNSFVEKSDIPNILLYSSFPGTGKSTTAKALCNDIGAEVLFINASKEGNIDKLRTDIEHFAGVLSLEGLKKIVILDEIDGASAKFLDSLRSFTEEYSRVCRFICTCNYITKIPEPIQSRFQVIDFNFSSKEIREDMIPKVCNRIKLILKHEKIEFDETVVDTFVQKCYPDIRKVLKTLSQEASANGIIGKELFETQTNLDELFELILNKKLTAARRYVIENGCEPDEIYTKLFKEFIPRLEIGIQWEFIILINDYSFKSAFVKDKEICLAACLCEIVSKLAKIK